VVSKIKKKRNIKSMPLIMTITVMITIVSIVGIAKESVRFHEFNNNQKIPANVETLTDKQFNQSELSVLLLLSKWIIDPEYPVDMENNTYIIYFNNLKKYFSRSDVNLSSQKALEIKDLVNERNKIVCLEDENNITHMSFDGQRVAIYILKRIYDLSGLKLLISEEGDISQITDIAGNNIYQKKAQIGQEGYQLDTLFITLSVLFVLLIICIVITRKNQLFVKGGRYNGYDKKEFA
jgi:hypothetical protein